MNQVGINKAVDSVEHTLKVTAVDGLLASHSRRNLILIDVRNNDSRRLRISGKIPP